MAEQKVVKSQRPAPQSSAVNTFRYQQMQTKTTEDFYLSTRLADVHFAFGSNGGDKVARIPAHKHLLAVVSDVFEKMFYGALKEAGDVTITDASHAVFKEFLQFFYLSNVELSVENIIDILYLGHKYNVKECIVACVEFLQDNITDENVCAVLTPAIFFEHPKLIKLCDAHIKLNTAAAIKSSSFLECHREVLARMLMMNLLTCTELEVFEACMAWVKLKSGQEVLTKEIIDKYLGDLFEKIPFGSMTIHQFCTLAAKYNMVFGREFHSISNMIEHPGFNQTQKVNKFQWQFKWNGRIGAKSISNRFPQWINIDLAAKLILLSILGCLLLWNLLCNV